MESINFKAALKDCQLFRKLNETDIFLLIHHSKMKPYAEGETIYQKGDTAQGAFGMIVSGKVGLVAADGRMVKGLGNSEVLGELGVVSHQHKHPLTVKAIQPTEILEWRLDKIQTLVPDLLARLKELAWKNISNYMDN